jgi:hypothetical protein
MDTTKALEAIGYSTTKPTKSGWHFVIPEPMAQPGRVYVKVTESGLTYGYSPIDDGLILNAKNPELVMYKKI